ncbi:High mobility group protein B1 [Lemmus lemmus]
MGKGGPKKPRGKMSSYAFSMKICREEHKKKHLDASVNCSEFSKKCSERWKNTSANEKGKSEDTAKADKARYEREMKTYIPPKGETEKKFQPQIKGEHLILLSIGDVAKKLGEMWNNTAADDKQPSTKRIFLHTEIKENPMQRKEGWPRQKRARKRRKRRMMKILRGRGKKWKTKMRKKMMMMNKLVLAQFFFLSIKHLAPLYTTHSF